MLSETQTLGGMGGLARSGTQNYQYDAANRLTYSYLGTLGTPIEPWPYVYDADGNRTSVTEAGVSFAYTYNALDELVTTRRLTAYDSRFARERIAGDRPLT